MTASETPPIAMRFRVLMLGAVMANLVAVPAEARLKVVLTAGGLDFGDHVVRVATGGDLVIFAETFENCGGRVTAASITDGTQSPVVIDDPASSGACTNFGEAVAGSTEHVIVGDRASEYALVYDHGGHLEQTLRLPDLLPDDFEFGRGVAVGATMALVRSRAAVYWFDLATQQLRAVLQSPSSTPSGFGSALAITGHMVFVADEEAQEVYGYDSTTQAQVWLLQSPFDEFEDDCHARFGRAIAADDESLVVAGAVDGRRGGREVLLLVDPLTGRIQRQMPLPLPSGSTFRVSLNERWVVADVIFLKPRVHYRTYVLDRRSGELRATIKAQGFEEPALAAPHRILMPISGGFRVLGQSR